MRRRERLTGFFIIFLLLTFSAYSNSMNVGGRIVEANRQPVKVEEASRVQRREVSSRDSSNFSQNNYQNTEAENNKDSFKENTVKDEKKEKQIVKTEENQIQDQLEINNNASKSEKNQVDLNQKVDLNRDRNYNNQLENPREDTENRDNNQKTTFEKIKEPKLQERIKVHKVEKGETLWDIAHKYDLNIDTLIGANNISNMNSIKPGQEFKILPVKGIMYRVSPGESVASIARKFKLEKETVMKDNNLEDASNLKIDQKLILRNAKPEFSYQDRLDKKFMYPINTRITSYYGPRWGRTHEGIDFAAPTGSPIRAVSSGRVVYSGWATGYGYVVIIEHQKGLRTLYAHNSKLLVSEGEAVGKGEVISRSGNTGNSTGPHLHFEVQVNGRPENPLNYITKQR